MRNAVGSTRLLTFETFDAAGAPANATTVVLRVVRPDGSVLTANPTPSETGRYAYALKLDSPGFWSWSWDAGGGTALDRVASDSVLVESPTDTSFVSWTTLADMLDHPALKKVAEAGNVDLVFLERCGYAATEFLHSRTRRRFKGLAVVHLRPCCSCVSDWTGTAWWLAWTGWSGSGDRTVPVEGSAACGCSDTREVVLPDDVREVLSVSVDGVTLDTDDWRLDGQRLVRTDDTDWPCCNHVEPDDLVVGVFDVLCVVGSEVYEIARQSAAELGCELYLSSRDPAQCRIPTRVTQTTRQGVTYSRVDTSTLGRDGLLGLRTTDIFLSEYGKRRRRLAIASPDVPETARRIG